MPRGLLGAVSACKLHSLSMLLPFIVPHHLPALRHATGCTNTGEADSAAEGLVL